MKKTVRYAWLYYQEKSYSTLNHRDEGRCVHIHKAKQFRVSTVKLHFKLNHLSEVLYISNQQTDSNW